MKKNKHAHSRTHVNKADERSKVLLIIAVLFFLLGLWLFARSAGYSFGTSGSGFNNETGSGTNQPGTGGRGGTGGTGSGGQNGAGGQNGTNDQNGNGSDNSGDGTNVNVNTDSGLEIDAGVDEGGNLYISPQVNPNPEGGAGGEASVDDKKIIDTDSLFGN